MRARGAGMERKQASDFDPEVLKIFDQYVHGLIDRRGFLERAARFAAKGVTAAILLDALTPRFAEAHQIAKDNGRPARVGVVGFWDGGGIGKMVATRIGELAGAVPFYGTQPPAEEVDKIKAPLLIHYAEKDERINAGIPAFEAALKANHVKYEMFTYPGTQHGFNNDTTPRYDKAAAALAWQRTLEFFKKNLRG